MKNSIIYSIRHLAMMSLLLVMTACSNDTELIPEQPAEPETAELSFLLPNYPNSEGYWGGTRAGYDTSKEPAFSNIYLVAFRSRAEDGTTYANPVINVKSLEEASTVNGYKRYTTSLVPGYYKLYVVANLNRYLNDGVVSVPLESWMTDSEKNTSVIDAASFEQLVLHFNFSQPLVPGHLPMACMHKDIRDSSNATLGTNEVLITKANPGTFYADLTYLCSKVRYTLLFDATQPDAQGNGAGISADFKNNSIRFSVDDKNFPFVWNVRKHTKLGSSDQPVDAEHPFIESSSEYQNSYGQNSTTGYWILQLYRYNYPMNPDGTPNNNYPANPADQLEEWTGNVDEVERDWKPRRRKAWQGVVYLPENDFDQNVVEHTKLGFRYVTGTFPEGNGGVYTEDPINPLVNYKIINLFGDNFNEKHFGTSGGNYTDQTDPSNTLGDDSHGLKRGYFYDVVGRIVKPDKLEVTVCIQAKPWVYNPGETTW